MGDSLGMLSPSDRGHYTLVHANGTSLEVAVHKPQYYLYFLNDPETIDKLAELSELVL